MPIVLGELTAGIIVGPFALGAIPAFNGEPLVVLDGTSVIIMVAASTIITPLWRKAAYKKEPQGSTATTSVESQE